MRLVVARLALILALGLAGLSAAARVLAKDGPVSVEVDKAEGIPFMTAPVAPPEEAPLPSSSSSSREVISGNDPNGGNVPTNDWELWLAIGILGTGGVAGALSFRGKRNWDVNSPKPPTVKPATPRLARGGPTDAPYEEDRFAGQVLKPLPPEMEYRTMLTPEEQETVGSFATDYLATVTTVTQCRLNTKTNYGLCLAALDALKTHWGEDWGTADEIFPMYREGERGKWAQFVFNVQAQNEGSGEVHH